MVSLGLTSINKMHKIYTIKENKIRKIEDKQKNVINLIFNNVHND